MKNSIFEERWEICQALENGKMIRHCSWNGHQFFVKFGDVIINEKNETKDVHILSMTPGNWSIYEPPKMTKTKVAPVLYKNPSVDRWQISTTCYKSLEEAQKYIASGSIIVWPASSCMTFEVEVEDEH